MNTPSRKQLAKQLMEKNRNTKIEKDQFRANLQIFIQKVETEVSQIIEKYQKRIKKLQIENKALQKELGKQILTQNEEMNPEQLMNITNNFAVRQMSPIIKKSVNLKETCKKLELHKSMQFKSFLDFSAEDLSNSRFELQKVKSKAKQYKIISNLQAGKNSLQSKTTKMFDLLGKNTKKQKFDSSESGQDNQQEQIKTNSQRRSLNSSISSVCESMDNSFHGKKSKIKNALKRKQKLRLKQMRLAEAIKNFKDKKQQGLQNLLRNLRQNITSVESKPLEVLKTVKISNSAYEVDEHFEQKKSIKSRVLIDPNPVYISQFKSSFRLDREIQKPQSILKNSSRILTKSMIQ